MLRPYENIEIGGPKKIPDSVVLNLYSGVYGMAFQGELKNGKLEFCIGPTSGPIIPRIVTFSETEDLSLPYDYNVAGNFELDGKTVFVLLKE